MSRRKQAVTEAELRSAMDRHERSLVRYAERIVRDVERARDVVQDTFLRLLRTDNAPDAEHLAQWLFTVCRNRALDVVRKEKRMTTLSDAYTDSAASGDPSPPEAAADREALGRVGRILVTLPERQQEVIRLKFQNGFSYRQIAGVTGLSVTNVGLLIHTAIKTLRRQLGGAGLKTGRTATA